jgi:hypothetical protein
MVKPKSRNRPITEPRAALREIARSPMMKTHVTDGRNPKPAVWGLQNGREITEKCALELIRSGAVVPAKDGLCDTSQTFVLADA